MNLTCLCEHFRLLITSPWMIVIRVVKIRQIAWESISTGTLMSADCMIVTCGKKSCTGPDNKALSVIFTAKSSIAIQVFVCLLHIQQTITLILVILGTKRCCNAVNISPLSRSLYHPKIKIKALNAFWIFKLI